MKTLLVLLLLGAAGVAGTLAWRGSAAAPVEAAAADMLFEARRGDLNITITENGELVAKDSQNVSPDIRGRNKIEWLIEEGKLVEEGEVVCRLDTTDLKKEVEQLELDLLQADADFKSATTELEIQETDNTAALEKARIDLEKSRMELERYRDGDSGKERRTLEIAIKDSETTLAQKKKKFEDSRMLVEKGYLNQTELELDEIEFEKAQVQWEGAKLDLDLFERYTLPMTMTEKDTAVRDAERNLQTSEKRAASQLQQKQVALEQASKRLDKMREQLEEKREQIEKCVLKAPCPGLVIYGDPKEPWYREEIKVGAEIWGQTTIVTIPDLRVMQVKVNIHEADITKLKEGQRATVTMDSYPGTVLHGNVTKIAGIAGEGNRFFGDSSEVKRFPVEITLEESSGLDIRPGVSAKAEIFVEKKIDVVYVPIQCVFQEEGLHYCYVRGATGPVSRKVTPGLNNDSFLEILEGLERGESVLLYNPNLPAQQAAGEPDPEGPEPAAGPGEGDAGIGAPEP